MKWRAILGLLIVYIAILFNLEWIWGIFFIFWIIPDLLLKQTHFIEVITKKNNPVLYWSILFTWFILGIYMLLNPLLNFDLYLE